MWCVFALSGQSCQQAGSKCYSVTTAPYGVVGGSCCDSCRPYIANGGSSWDGTTDWYCQYGSTGGSEGATCVSKYWLSSDWAIPPLSQGTYTGNCATGLTCTNGVCSSSSSSSNTTASSAVVTTASTSNATTCTANAGDVCEDSTYNITKTCCSPYTCETLTSRTKTCSGSNLAVNETCFDSGSVSGPALYLVLTVETAVCRNLRLRSGLSGREMQGNRNLCWPSLPQQFLLLWRSERKVSQTPPAPWSTNDIFQRQVATCCDGSYCVQPSSSSDSFCMRFDIGQGFQCGDTEARVDWTELSSKDWSF